MEFADVKFHKLGLISHGEKGEILTLLYYSAQLGYVTDTENKPQPM
jgi:hypothetical protein